jgi:hypothetical protein
MRDLLSKLDAIVSETELKNPEDLQAKRKALQDLQMDPVASQDPEIKQAIIQRKADLEKEAKSKGFAESFQIGDEFGISFTEDHEIATTIVDILEDGIVIELDDTALDMLTNEGLEFLEGELVEDKQKGVDGKACWKGYKRMGTKQKGGKTVDNCVKMEDHGPENPDAPVNYGEYDREGDMAKDDLRTIDDAAEELYSILRADDNLPEWVQSKITKAVDYIDTARDYMKAQNYEEGVAENYPKHQDLSGISTDKLKAYVAKYTSHPMSGEGAQVRRVRAELQRRAEPDFGTKDDEEENQWWIDHDVKEGVAEGSLNESDKFTSWYDWKDQAKSSGYTITKKDDKIVALNKQGQVVGHWSDVGKFLSGKAPRPNFKRPEEQGVAEGDVDEAKYQGREVPLGKKMAGDVKKSKVYVRKPNGNIVKVNFGDKKMRIKKSNPARRKSFRARHNCANPGPRHKARYWSCRSW